MQLKLTNVRLSFPQLFVPKAVAGGTDARYNANFLLHKTHDAAQIDAVRKAMFAVATEKWGQKIPPTLKKCLQEASEKAYDGYDADHMFVSASATVRPTVIDRNMSPLDANSGRPYAGCLVHAVIRLWAQDNQYGKRINAQLQGVQFASDGEAFGAAPFDPTTHFTPEVGAADQDGFDGGDAAGFDAHKAQVGVEIDPATGFPKGF